MLAADRHCRIGIRAALLLALVLLSPEECSAARGGKLKLVARDAQTNTPVAVRMHLKDAKGKAILPPKTVAWKDHFVFDGEITLTLPVGRYTFEIERGPEYKDYRGNFEMRPFGDDAKIVALERIVDLSSEGWWSGDLHVHRPLKDMNVLLRAEDLQIAPVLTWWKGLERWTPPAAPLQGIVEVEKNRYVSDLAGEDERRGGALLYFGLKQPLPLAEATRDFPSPLAVLKAARQTPGIHVDLEKPFWWDAPVWLALGQIDSIGLANNHLWREGVLDNEAWGRPRDRDLYPPAHGVGQWSEAIYYRLLNCGLRVPPSAGSASGVLPNPVGYNRVYVHCGSEFSYQSWFENLRAGRVFVTNGPLLRAHVEGHPPGHVFRARRGEALSLQPGVKLSTRDPIDYLEVIRDGEPVVNLRLDQFIQARGEIPPLEFTESGWFLIRVVAAREDTYRFASTGPFYVEFDDTPRVSAQSAQFFIDWIDERTAHLEKNDLPPAATLTDSERDELLSEQHAARKFWQQLRASANAD